MKKIFLSIFTYFIISSAISAQGGEWHLSGSISSLKVDRLTQVFNENILYMKPSISPTISYQYFINNKMGFFLDFSFFEHNIDNKRFSESYNVEISDPGPFITYFSSLGFVYRTPIFKKLSFDFNFGMGIQWLFPVYIETKYYKSKINDDILSSISSDYNIGVGFKGNVSLNYPIYKNKLFIQSGFQLIGAFSNQERHQGIVNNVANSGYSYNFTNRVDYLYQSFSLGLILKIYE
jgi:hypothetical protein